MRDFLRRRRLARQQREIQVEAAFEAADAFVRSLTFRLVPIADDQSETTLAADGDQRDDETIGPVGPPS